MNARSDVPSSIPRSVPGEAGCGRPWRREAITLRDNRFAAAGWRGAGRPACQHYDRDVEPRAKSDDIVGIGGRVVYRNGPRLGYDPAILSRIFALNLSRISP
jgi:hypothetical protein